MDFKKLAEVPNKQSGTSKGKLSAEQKKAILDSLKKKRAEAAKKKAISDSLKKKRAEAAKKKAISDSLKNYYTFKVTDSYKNLKKKIKDELEETESTDAAIETALDNITPDAPAEQVLAAVIEVLGDTIDELQDDVIEDEPED